jgi:hypothetical protein
MASGFRFQVNRVDLDSEHARERENSEYYCLLRAFLLRNSTTRKEDRRAVVFFFGEGDGPGNPPAILL